MKDVYDSLSFYLFNIIMCSMFGRDFYGDGIIKEVFDEKTCHDASKLITEGYGTLPKEKDVFEKPFKVNSYPEKVYGVISFDGNNFNVKYKSATREAEVKVIISDKANAETGLPFSYVFNGVDTDDVALFCDLDADSDCKDINKLIEFV